MNRKEWNSKYNNWLDLHHVLLRMKWWDEVMKLSVSIDSESVFQRENEEQESDNQVVEVVAIMTIEKRKEDSFLFLKTRDRIHSQSIQKKGWIRGLNDTRNQEECNSILLQLQDHRKRKKVYK